MIQESAKGTVAEQAAWQMIRTRTAVHTQNKIKEMLDFIKEHPEIRYIMLKSGAFTYKTAVSVVDQLVSNGVTYLSHTISFVEDRTRRKLNDKFDSLMKWVIIIVPIIFAVAIGAVIFLIGTGMVGGKS
jgi:3-dehydroquinate dehydratase